MGSIGWDRSRMSGEEFRPGQVCTGVVMAVTEFGVFVDLGTASGIVTVPNLSWRKFDHPSETAQVGQSVIAVVLSIDPDRDQVSLSLKELEHDPFIDFARTKFGSTITGPVTRIAPVGVFVQLDDEFVGFLPQPELDRSGLAPEFGDGLTASVTYVNVEDRQIVLSSPTAYHDA